MCGESWTQRDGGERDTTFKELALSRNNCGSVGLSRVRTMCKLSTVFHCLILKVLRYPGTALPPSHTHAEFCCRALAFTPIYSWSGALQPSAPRGSANHKCRAHLRLIYWGRACSPRPFPSISRWLCLTFVFLFHPPATLLSDICKWRAVLMLPSYVA